MCKWLWLVGVITVCRCRICTYRWSYVDVVYISVVICRCGVHFDTHRPVYCICQSTFHPHYKIARLILTLTLFSRRLRFSQLPRTGKILGNGYFTAVFIPIGKRRTFPQGSRPLPPKKSCLFSYSVIDILSRRFDILSWMWGKIPSFFLTSGENSPMYPKVDMSKRTQCPGGHSSAPAGSLPAGGGRRPGMESRQRGGDSAAHLGSPPPSEPRALD